MFGNNDGKNELKEAIELRISELGEVGENDSAKVDDLKKLVEVKEKLEGPRFWIDPNTVITALASIGGILLMLNYEKLDVITSKVLNFIPKPRL